MRRYWGRKIAGIIIRRKNGCVVIREKKLLTVVIREKKLLAVVIKVTFFKINFEYLLMTF